MTGEGGHHCRSCGATLRRGHTGALCDPCARAARSYGQCPVPDGFYDTPALRTALVNYDFGPVFRAVRLAGALSQEELGLLVGLSQARVSDVERGAHRLRDVAVIARVAGALGIPARLLGFDPTPASAGGVNVDEEVSWVDRRDFLALVTAATVGSGVYEELDRLADLLPTHVEPVTRPRIGAADIEAIDAVTDGLRRSGATHGGGVVRAAAIAQLNQVCRLDDAVCSDTVRARLHLAIADLAMMAAYVSFDATDHDCARRLWTFALGTARRCEDHPRSTDLTVNVLLDTAEQSLYLHRPTDALRLVRLASATGSSRKHPVDAITRSMTSSYLGWCWAALGESTPCGRAMGQSREDYAAADPNTAPPWAQWMSDSEIAALHGHSSFLLSRANPGHAPVAIEHLRSALDAFDTTHATARAVNLPSLAASYFHAGEVEAAVATGHEAVTAISALSSKRAYPRLRALADTAKPHSHHSDVAELRERIRGALATAA